MIIFNKKLSQPEIIRRLANEMPKGEYASLTSQILSLAEADSNRGLGQTLNIMA
ncbi:MAG: hypothetical protein MJ231_00895 [bacterium]|nr:hypothetical protein [bacterium]